MGGCLSISGEINAFIIVKKGVFLQNLCIYYFLGDWMTQGIISVLYVTSEAAGYVGTSPLAVASAQLPLAVREVGPDIRLTFPKYGFMSERRCRIHEITRLKEFEVPVAGGKDFAWCKSSSLNNIHSKVQVYVIGNQTYFGRMGVYADPGTNKEYADNGERFAFFCRSILETCKLLGWRPSIIHCNDWQTGLIPAYAKLLYGNDGFFTGTKFIFTIHNINNQGAFDKSVFDITELPAKAWSKDGVQQGKQINFMKAGIQYADMVTTVSEGHAKEITERGGGFGLEDVLAQKKRGRKLIGILNGIDYDVWNPAKDTHIKQKFNKDSLGDKVENKRAFCDKAGFDFQSDTPLIGFVNAFTEENGMGIIQESLQELSKMNGQFYFHGKGSEKYQDTLTKFAKKHPGSFAVNIGANETLEHQLYASCDIMIFPTQYEPGGTQQLRALRYGAVPIAHATGGLADAVQEPPGTKANPATGFAFQKFTAADFQKTMKRALTAWNDHEAWKKIQLNGMTKDVSWKSTAQKYTEIYKTVLK